jgi:3-hydroxybutyryl-CoA dehydrogenase
MKSPQAADYVLGVVGAGAMGQGIVQVAATGGVRVLLLDAAEGAAQAGRDKIAGRIARLAEKGRLAPEEADAAIARIVPVVTMADLAPCDAVVEAIVENPAVKQKVFAEIEAAVSPDCLITSNTSSIPIAAIATACKKRDRIAGLHFFNPVPLMKLVEVIRPVEASDATIDALSLLGERLGRVPVTVKDSPGFLVNMGGRAMTTEGVRLVHEGVATPAQVDAVMRDVHGFRMGPFELMDLTGIDVNYPVSRLVWDGYGCDPRITTYPPHRALLDAGLFGRKTGRGWFEYGEGAAERPSADFEPQGAAATRVALAEGDPALGGFLAPMGVDIMADDGTCPILAAPVGEDATTTALRTGVDARRLVCIDLVGNPETRVTVMTAPGADPAARDAVAAMLVAAGRRVTAITDSPGFIGQRMAAMIANLGCHIAELGLASPADIDRALELGLNYPRGPLALGEAIGAGRVLAILTAAQAVTGEDRYRPTPWLSRRARLGLPLHTAA